MAETGIVKAIRLDSATLERIAAHRARLQARIGRMTTVNEGMAMRDLLLLGLDMAEGMAGKESPEHPRFLPSPEPSGKEELSLPVPAVPVQVETARQPPLAAPGLQHCTAVPGHRDYSASARECPMCANNRRSQKSKALKKEGAQKGESQHD